jgi:hypothetical protein
VPSSPSNPAGGTETPEAQGKVVSSAETAPGDANPADADPGAVAPQPAAGPEDQSNLAPSKPATGSYNDPDTPVATAGPSDVKEGPGGVDPHSDATNPTDSPRGAAGTPLPSRGVPPETDKD